VDELSSETKQLNDVIATKDENLKDLNQQVSSKDKEITSVNQKLEENQTTYENAMKEVLMSTNEQTIKQTDKYKQEVGILNNINSENEAMISSLEEKVKKIESEHEN
jgi:predicted  nucleic acid-binding Zn-ribbon protein